MKFFMLSIATLTLTWVAGATAVMCTPQPITFANGVGSGTVTCPGVTPDPGFNLSSVVLTLSADYLNGAFTGTNDARVTFTPSSIPGVTWTPSSQFIDVIGGFSSASQPQMTIVATAFDNSSFSSGITTTVSSSTISGAVFESSGNVVLTYTETSLAPEPATTGLMGVALLSLGMIRLRKNKIANIGIDRQHY